jgi:lysophospholipase
MTIVTTLDNPFPPFGVEEHIRAADGVRLRTIRWSARGAPRGAVAVFGGRGEFIEKYFEVIEDLLSRGFAVAALDWRGQGGSDRPLRDSRKGHVDDFSHFERDLAAMVEHVLEPQCPHPWFGLGHSMGAAVLLSSAHAGRPPFERLVLTSPLIAAKRVKTKSPVRYLVEALDGLGLGGAFVPGNNGLEGCFKPFEGNVWTSDPDRFARTAQLVSANPDAFSSGLTIGWLHAAFRAMRRFEQPNFPRATLTPILIIASGADQVTDTAAAERFASRLRAGRIVVIDGAQHEILIERDTLRDQFWAAFDAFVPGLEAAAETERAAS